MPALVPNQRAEVVEAAATNSRKQGGDVWKLALEVSGIPDDSANGTYVLQGCPMGFPVWEMTAQWNSPKNATRYLTYCVTEDHGMTWYISSKAPGSLGPGFAPPSNLDTIAFTAAGKDGAIPQGKQMWSSQGTDHQITVDLIPHPAFAEHKWPCGTGIQHASAWKVPAAPATEQQQLCDKLTAAATEFLKDTERHNVDDMIKEVLMPPKYDNTVGAGAGLTVDDYYSSVPGTANEKAAKPQHMESLRPVHGFRLGALEPADGGAGFEKTLKDTLVVRILGECADAMPHGKEDWEDMMNQVLALTANIARAKDMPKTHGFGEVDDLCSAVLHNGRGRDAGPGYCVEIMADFLKNQLDIETRQESEGKPGLQGCVAEVRSKQAALKEIELESIEISLLEELCYDTDAIEGKDAEKAAELRERLVARKLVTDTSSTKEGIESVIKAADEFTVQVVDILVDNDKKLNVASNELIAALMKTAQVLLERVSTMETILPQIDERRAKVVQETTDLQNQCVDKRKKAEVTVQHTKERIIATQAKIVDVKQTRVNERQQFKVKAEALQANNVKLQAEIEERLRQIKANEDALRVHLVNDQALEKNSQMEVARCEQQLGTMAGCLDEMQNFVESLRTSEAIIESVRTVGTQFLTDHDHSMKVLVMKDIERTEEQLRVNDTEHFARFCAAFKRSVRDELNAKVEKHNLETRIKLKANQRRGASQARNSALVDQIQTDIRDFQAQKELILDQIEENDKLQTNWKQGLAPVLERLGNGYICVLKDDARKAKRKLVRSRDKDLLDKITATTTYPELQTLPPDDPTDELFAAVQADHGVLVSGLENAQTKNRAELEQLRQDGLSEILGRTYKPMQLEDAGKLNRTRSKPSGDALSQTSSARRRAAAVGAAIPEGDPPTSGGGGFWSRRR